MRGVKVRSFKKPGHFIGADACRFFRHDHVGRYCISTIGDYHPRSRPEAPWEPLGYYTAPTGETRPAKYETAVFDTRAKRHRWVTLDMRCGETEEAAVEAHEALVTEFTRVATRQARQREAKSHGGRIVVPPGGKVGVVARSPRRGRDR